MSDTHKECTIKYKIPVYKDGETTCFSNDGSCPFLGVVSFGTKDVCCYPNGDSFQTELNLSDDFIPIPAKHCPFTKED